MSIVNASIPPPLPANRRRTWAIAFGVLTVVGAVYVYCIDPVHSLAAPGCWFFELTGLYCPGCGGTRALHAVLHGHPVHAVTFNPLIVVAIPLGIVTFIRYVRGDDSGDGRVLRPAWIWVIFIAMVGFWVARNIPAYPFTLLAPH